MTTAPRRWVCSYLEVPQEMPEVDVEQLPTLSDHDVVGVPVSDAQDIGGHTVASYNSCAAEILRQKTKAYRTLQL